MEGLKKPEKKKEFNTEDPDNTEDTERKAETTWYTCPMNVIVKDPEILGGTPVFRGTRVPIQTMFDYLEGGETLEDFLEGFPTVSRQMALAALEEAKQLLLARL